MLYYHRHTCYRQTFSFMAPFLVQQQRLFEKSAFKSEIKGHPSSSVFNQLHRVSFFRQFNLKSQAIEIMIQGFLSQGLENFLQKAVQTLESKSQIHLFAYFFCNFRLIQIFSASFASTFRNTSHVVFALFKRATLSSKNSNSWNSMYIFPQFSKCNQFHLQWKKNSREKVVN